jgi:hypothetical protein
VNNKFAPVINPYFTGTIHSANAIFTNTVSADLIQSTHSDGWNGGAIELALPQYTHGAGLTGSLRMDYYEDKFRIFENASPFRGVYLDLRYTANSVGTNLFNIGASWSSVISTNTALRLLINDRLQVANANAKYTTKAYAASNSYVKLLLANTNAYIADVAAAIGSGGGGGGGYAGETIDYGSIATAIDIELNRDYGTL